MSDPVQAYRNLVDAVAKAKGVPKYMAHESTSDDPTPQTGTRREFDAYPGVIWQFSPLAMDGRYRGTELDRLTGASDDD